MQSDRLDQHIFGREIHLHLVDGLNAAVKIFFDAVENRINEIPDIFSIPDIYPYKVKQVQP